MAFSSDRNTEENRRISLSFRAFNIVQADMRAFDNKYFANFINRVIMNFKDTADASVGFAVYQEEEKLRTQFENLFKNEKGIDRSKRASMKEEVIETLKTVKIEELMKKNLSYERHISKNIRLQKDTLKYLIDECSDCTEDKYYGEMMCRYMKALVEEYASLPFYERELIYFKDTVDLVNKAIQEEKVFNFRASNGNKYMVRPVEILTDTMKTYNYIVGYTYNSEGDAPYPASYRLSGFSEAKLLKETAHISVKKREKLSEQIRSRGVQFLLGQENEIIVKLTDLGKKRFSREIHLRPPLDRIDDNGDYIFNCTEAQAEFYFVKFGKDAYVVKPESLRNKLKNIYKEALESYNANE